MKAGISIVRQRSPTCCEDQAPLTNDRRGNTSHRSKREVEGLPWGRKRPSFETKDVGVALGILPSFRTLGWQWVKTPLVARNKGSRG
jgi:hypothetical protein